MREKMSTITVTARPRLSKRARLQWDPVRQRQVILVPEGVLVLNETAAAILALCDGQRTVLMLAAELGARYGRDVGEEVLQLLNRLEARQVVEVSDG
jgi:pyrroloquinoline quinone biosynthesis protein D